MSWNAATILKSIKNGTQHRKSNGYLTWNTETMQMSLNTSGVSGLGYFLTIRMWAAPHTMMFQDFVQLKPGEIQTCERIILRKLLA